MIEARIVREIRFDPDAWVLEVEDRAGRHFLERVVDWRAGRFLRADHRLIRPRGRASR